MSDVSLCKFSENFLIIVIRHLTMYLSTDCKCEIIFVEKKSNILLQNFIFRYLINN